MHVGVVGTGYVGLVTGTCFADLGLNVLCVDSDGAKVEALKQGSIPIYEPGLEEMLRKNIGHGRLSFTTELAEAVRRCLVLILAVGTPTGEDGHADLSAIEAVAKAIGENLNGYKVIATKSTVPAGTGARIRELVHERRPARHAFDVVSNPEFLREGSALEDFMRPDRIVVGAESAQAVAIMQDLYRPLTVRGTPLVVTDVETAEVIKYASNAFLATKVAFINEVAALCESVGADVKMVSRGMGLDRRIGEAFLNPGPGYGGSCFPKDTEAFAALGRRNQAPLTIVQAVIGANEGQRERCLGKIVEALDGEVSGKRIGVLGLSFKPDTDDMREAPAVPILTELVARGAEVRAFDPEAMENARPLLPGTSFCSDTAEAAEGADVLVIFTEWNLFRALDWRGLKDRMRRPRVVDLRNLYEPQEMQERGFEYACIGRGTGRGGCQGA